MSIGKVSEFMSVIVQLANESAKIIHSIQTGGLKAEKWKGENDPMTVADVKAQTLILKGIRSIYPKIKIVGEESVEYEGDLGYDVSKLNLNLIPEQYFLKGNSKNLFNIDDVVVWVDPLDGTLSYVKEEYDAVTTLIGVSLNNQPLMGLISQIYQQDAHGKHLYAPKIFFSHVDTPTVFYAYGEELDEEERTSCLPYELKLKKKPISSMDQLIGSTSKHRVKPHVLEFIQKQLNPVQLVQTGGSGKKALLVLEQQVDYCVHLSGKASRWDTIAPEALLICAGGQLTDIQGNNYKYDPSLKSYYNVNGGVYTLRKDVHDFIISKTKEFALDQ